VNIRIFDSAERASHAAARVLARQLKARPESAIGLPTGRTFVPVYERLVRLAPDFSRAHTFSVDEFVGIPPADSRSFRSFMERHLFRHVRIHESRVHFLDGTAKSLASECDRFERAIAAAGGIDLLLLGIGANGHIAFNEPAPALVARTHRARLAVSSRKAWAAVCRVPLGRVPKEALSMGVGTILAARAVVLVATGPSKAAAIRKMTSGRVSPAVPASFLQLHPNVQLILDRTAARSASTLLRLAR
jgi:glucosamine-6-phosphate deaminase